MAAAHDPGQAGGGGTTPVAVILAGGRAERMGGLDKCLLDVGGRPILSWILDAIRPAVPDILISANGFRARFSGFGCPVVPDPAAFAGQGPLAGLVAAAAARPGHPILSLPGDAPFLPAGLAPALLAAAAARPAFVRHAGRDHPTLAAFPAGALDGLPDWLVSSGRRAVAAWLEHAGAAPLDWPGTPDRDPPMPDPFMNVNRPADLAAARQAAGRVGQPGPVLRKGR